MNLRTIRWLYLLQWPIEWDDGLGAEQMQAIYDDYETALEAGREVVRSVFGNDPDEDMEQNYRIFNHAREDGHHWCGGVLLKPVPYFPKG